jgi:muconolactone delta-isomerase
MRQLIITRTKDIFYSLPDERRMVLMEATGSYIQKYKSAGKFRRVYVVPGGGRAMAILDVDSHEEANSIALENPMMQFMEMETHNLVEWDTYIRQMRESYAELAVAR